MRPYGRKTASRAFMRHIGIDISDRSIEIVSLLQRRDGLVVDLAGRRELAAGVIERGVIQDADALVKTLAGAFDALFGAKRGRLDAAVALPATVVYSKTFTMPAGLDREMMRKAVAIEAADVFPMPLQDAVDDIIVAPQPADGPQEAFYAACSKEVANAYRNALVRAGATPSFLEPEDQALVRGIGAARPAEPVLVVDLGNRTTLIEFVDRSGLRMSASIPFGGANLVTALEKKLKTTLQEGEKLLRTQGFDPAAGDSRTFFVLQQPTEELITEIRKTLAYAERRYGLKARAILLVGGVSLSPGIAEYLGSNFQGMVVGRGRPARDVAVEGTELAGKEGVLFATALGLAMRAADPRGSPGMDLTPHKAPSKNVFQGARTILSGIFKPFTMVTHGKKSHPKKKRAAAEPVAPAETPADLPVEEAPVPAPEAASAPAPEPVVPAAPAAVAADVVDVTPPELAAKEPVAPAPRPAAPEPAEEPDFGLGIGDILRGEEEIKTQKVDLEAAPEAAPASDEGKLSIEDILSRGASPSKKAAPAPRAKARPAIAAGGGLKLPPGSGKVAALVILVLILFAVAAGGIYMFVKKNGLPKFANAPAANENVAPAPAPVPAPAAPTTVSLTAVIGTAQKDVPAGKQFVLSRVIETDVKSTDTFASTGTASVAAGKSCGTATIINTTSRSYTFVKTTRLLSKEGVLFRMTDASPIPANGSVDVHVCADQPGPSGDIGPTTFTIPGLSAELQKLITAKSKAAMTGGSGTAKVVSAADLAAARTKLSEKLKAEALDNFSAMLADGEKILPDLVTSKELSATFPKAGTAGSSFKATLSLRFRVLLTPEKAVTAALNAALAGGNAADASLGAPLYTVQAYDESAETAEVRVEAPVIQR